MRGGKNLVGQAYGRLIVIERAGSDGKNARWRCACSCGGEAMVGAHMLRQGYTKSCGCLRRESAARNGQSDNSRRAATDRMRAKHGPQRQAPHGALDDLAAAWRMA